MRQELLDYIKGLNIGTISVSNDLPFEDGGVPLYLKNAKTIYVDRPQRTSEPIIQTLNSLTISNETTLVSVYFSLDAKLLIANYESILTSLKAGKDVTTIQGVNRRECDITSEYEGDMLVTTLGFRFIRIT
jgi:hypothetical protein